MDELWTWLEYRVACQVLTDRLLHLTQVPPPRGNQCALDWDSQTWEPPSGFDGHWFGTYDAIYDFWPRAERAEEGHFWPYPLFYVAAALRPTRLTTILRLYMLTKEHLPLSEEQR